MIRTLVAGLLLAGAAQAAWAQATLLNVSHYVTREFDKDYYPVFAAFWKAGTGETVTINQSHGGSSKQASSVLFGNVPVLDAGGRGATTTYDVFGGWKRAQTAHSNDGGLFDQIYAVK